MTGLLKLTTDVLTVQAVVLRLVNTLTSKPLHRLHAQRETHLTEHVLRTVVSQKPSILFLTTSNKQQTPTSQKALM